MDVILMFNKTDIHGDSDYLRKEGDKNPKKERTWAGQVLQTILGKAWTYLTMRMEKRCTNMTMVMEIWLSNHGQIVRVNSIAQKLLENVS